MKNNKALGQHWLKNRAILDTIAALAVPDDASAGVLANGAAPDDMNTAPATKVGASDNASAATPLCVEIGPGLGTLTSSLLRRFAEVITVEYDQDLARKLPGQFPGKRLTVLNQDILQTDVAALAGGRPYVVAGNIPYYITQPIVRQLLAATPRPAKIVLLMQKEVAERIAAEPGDYTYLSVLVQNQAAVELGPVVKAAEFTPPPKVDSQILVLRPLDQPILSPAALNLACRGFQSPRKKLVANLATPDITKAAWAEILRQNGLNPAARAANLELLDWEDLVKNVVKITTTEH